MTDLSWRLWAVVFCATAAGFIAIVLLLRLLASRYQERFSREVQSELNAAFLFTNVTHLYWLNVVGVVVGVVLAGWITGHLAPAIAVAVSLAVVPKLILRTLRRRRVQAFRVQMPEILSLLSVSLKAGAALNTALGEIGEQLPAPARQEITMVLREQRMGRSLDSALGAFEARMPVEETMLLVSALRLGLRSGGSLAQTLAGLSVAMRRRLMLEGKVRALTAQGRMQAWVMGLLPFGVLAVLLVMQPELTDLYFATTEGLAVLGLVCLLQLIGGWVVSRMVAIEV
ncbi:MAG: type II secretion system F family protein [Burkholderiaceae bacterium]